jgi:rhodanese-related sulfurtransferase
MEPLNSSVTRSVILLLTLLGAFMTVTNLDNASLQKLMTTEPDLLLLDVRTPEEFTMLGHIPGAQLLPIHTIPDQMASLNPERKTVVICEHGVRSYDASQYLAHHGFKQVYQLAAGMADWNGPRSFSSNTEDAREDATH